MPTPAHLRDFLTGCPTCGTYGSGTDHARWCDYHPDHPQHDDRDRFIRRYEEERP